MSQPAALKSHPPLSAEQSGRLMQALDGLDSQALIWVSGFAAGLAQGRQTEQPTPAIAQEAAPAQTRLTVLANSLKSLASLKSR